MRRFCFFFLVSTLVFGVAPSATAGPLLLQPYDDLSLEEQTEVDALLDRVETLRSETKRLNRTYNVEAHGSAHYFFDLGRALYYQKRYSETIRSYTDGLRLAPGNGEAQLHLAQLLLL